MRSTSSRWAAVRARLHARFDAGVLELFRGEQAALEKILPARSQRVGLLELRLG